MHSSESKVLMVSERDHRPRLPREVRIYANIFLVDLRSPQVNYEIFNFTSRWRHLQTLQEETSLEGTARNEIKDEKKKRKKEEMNHWVNDLGKSDFNLDK